LSAGQRWVGPGVVFGELDQRRAGLEGAGPARSCPLLEVFVGATGLLQEEARSLLAKFGLGAEHVMRPAERLSPGERTRAILAALMARGVNGLVLDEPTNHLDLAAIEQLEEALDRFAGTLLLVSHDRWLLESIRLTRTVMVDGGRVTADRGAGLVLPH
jgi:ATPase subunit of ABC transporter with duplicated ATPase domains